jgi:hypothetical protein
MAGGVALNCVANGRVIRETPIKNLFVQPAAGDAGGAVGVAHYVHNTLRKQPRGKPWTHAYLGPGYSDAEIEEYLGAKGVPYATPSRQELIERTARLISEGNVIGWFQGRMEFGPRALGARSILADPRDPRMRDTLNMKIKFREGFRPFAPSVLADKASEWFEIDCDSPYMLLVAQVREGKRVIPSVTHVDNSARLQTVTRAESPLYYDLIQEFGRLTGVPVVINTSFNVRGEPIVCTPHDAYLCFMHHGTTRWDLPAGQEGATRVQEAGLADVVRTRLVAEEERPGGRPLFSDSVVGLPQTVGNARPELALGGRPRPNPPRASKRPRWSRRLPGEQALPESAPTTPRRFEEEQAGQEDEEPADYGDRQAAGIPPGSRYAGPAGCGTAARTRGTSRDSTAGTSSKLEDHRRLRGCWQG